MFRKALLSIALLAVLLTTFAPVHAEAPRPTIARTLTGTIVSLSETEASYLALTVSPMMRPVRVYVNKETQICLSGQLIDFNELRLGDSVKVTLQLTTARVYVAQLVEVFRKTGVNYPAVKVIPPTCGLTD